MLIIGAICLFAMPRGRTEGSISAPRGVFHTQINSDRVFSKLQRVPRAATLEWSFPDRFTPWNGLAGHLPD